MNSNRMKKFFKLWPMVYLVLHIVIFSVGLYQCIDYLLDWVLVPDSPRPLVMLSSLFLSLYTIPLIASNRMRFHVREDNE